MSDKPAFRSPFGDIAPQAASQAFAIRGIHVDLQVEQIANFRMVQRQDPFENQERTRGHQAGGGVARVAVEAIDGLFDGLAGAQAGEVFEEQVPIDGAGMVVVEPGARFER